jgi:RNA polymerase sigma-70 factor (ECF subfamily)
MDERELSQLAADFRAGDRLALKSLVERLTRTLIAMGYRYTHDWEMARDLTQETWIKVYRGIASYHPDKPFLPWLYTVHRNNCLSQLRKSAIRREQLVEHAELERIAGETSTQGPEETLRHRELRERILRSLRVLSASQLQVFLRVDLEQMEQSKAAESLGMKAATLRSTLHQARRRLAAALKKIGEMPCEMI